MKLQSKIAVVTGASSGIGEAVAKLFASEGATVALVARTVSSLDRVENEIIEAGGKAKSFSLDVSDTDKVVAVFADIEKEVGEIDVLVNCAGLFYPTPGGEMPEQEWRKMIDVNLGGTINACNAVLPNMKAREKGHIVNIASVAAVMTVSGYSIYCATKAAIVMLTKTLAAEFAPFGIHINSVAPGNTATAINQNIRTDPEMKVFLDGMEAATPSKRTFTEPESIASAVLFLASEESSPFYGAVLLADEGLSLGM